MLIGYARVSKADGSQSLDLQIDALTQARVKEEHIYQEKLSGKIMDRPELENCLRALREGDTLVVWKLDRLGRSLRHLVSIVDDLSERGVGLRVLQGQGANIDTTTPAGRMMFGIFSTLAEYERELIRERTVAGLASARARGRLGGRKFKLSKLQLISAQAAMRDRNTNVDELCFELGISKPTLYRYISPEGELRDSAKKMLEQQSKGKKS